MNDYNCECGENTSYGIHYDLDSENNKVYWIGSCCDGGTGVGCCSAYNIKFCPFCGKEIGE